MPKFVATCDCYSNFDGHWRYYSEGDVVEADSVPSEHFKRIGRPQVEAAELAEMPINKLRSILRELGSDIPQYATKEEIIELIQLKQQG